MSWSVWPELIYFWSYSFFSFLTLVVIVPFFFATLCVVNDVFLIFLKKIIQSERH